MRTFRAHTAIRTGITLAALAAVILAGALTVFRAEATDLSEVKKLTASATQADARFGRSVAVSGDSAIVGAPQPGFSAGAAYLFERDLGGPGNWGEVTTLTASDAQFNDVFGFSVAISGDTAIVGAFRLGAAYIFERNQGGPGNWGEVTTLTASDADGQFTDIFGFSVAISGDSAIVGDPQEDAGGVGFSAGAVYVFGRDLGGPGNWGEVQKLIASDAQGGDRFGESLAISGNSAIVGVPQAGDNFSGRAYVFERDEGGPDNWGEVTKLTASDAQILGGFGFAVAISGDTAIGGAIGETNAGGTDAGAAYVFERDQGGPGNWGEVKKLTASDAQPFDLFGTGVAISGGSAVVGAAAGGGGTAYVFKRDQGGPGNWGEVTKLTASDAEAGDGFGGSSKEGGGVALSGDTTVVGARGEDTGGADAGAAYVFDLLLPKPTATPTPTPDPSVGGIAELPKVAGASLETGGSSGGNAGVLAGVASAMAAVAVALGGAAWYARRRQ